MGYGFVQYYKKEHANEALKNLQVTTLDGKSLELKRSERGNTLVMIDHFIFVLLFSFR